MLDVINNHKYLFSKYLVHLEYINIHLLNQKNQIEMILILLIMLINNSDVFIKIKNNKIYS